MSKPKLTPEIKAQADAIVARFNAEELRDEPWAHYVTRYRGDHLYLGHQEGAQFWPVCRLTYTGDMNNWEFAIYKYSDERYDPHEWWFNGDEEVGGHHLRAATGQSASRFSAPAQGIPDGRGDLT